MLDLVNRYDVGMVERRCSLGLLHKALHPVWMSSDFNRQYLQRNFARQFRILRQIHLTHSALANLRADFVATEFCACCECHHFLLLIHDRIVIHLSFSYSCFASIRMGMSASASFHSARKS